MEGPLLANLAKRAGKMAQSLSKLRPEEAAVLTLLQRRLSKARQRKAAEPKTVKEALRRSLKLIPQHRKAS
jgi:hypothetical protein